MELLKKEWKTFLIAAWLMLITFFLVFINAKVSGIEQKSIRLSSTLDSVESVVLASDDGLNQISKKVQTMDSSLGFIVEKLRRK